jgi:ribosome assembly protein SQT1
MDGKVRVWRRVKSKQADQDQSSVEAWRSWEFLTSLDTGDEITVSLLPRGMNADCGGLIALSLQWISWHPKGPVLAAGCEGGTVWMWQCEWH